MHVDEHDTPRKRGIEAAIAACRTWPVVWNPEYHATLGFSGQASAVPGRAIAGWNRNFAVKPQERYPTAYRTRRDGASVCAPDKPGFGC